MAKRITPFWAVTCICLITIAIGWTVQTREMRSLESARKAFYGEKAASLGAAIEKHLVEAVEVAMAMRGVLNHGPEISRKDFVSLAGELRRDREYFLNIAYAPDMIVKYVFPAEGNEAVVGFDVRTRPDQWTAVRISANANKPVVAGPVPLVQGGHGFIVRAPLYDGAGIGMEHLRGVISIVISTQPITNLVNATGQDEAFVAIRGQDSLGAMGDLVAGPAHVFQRDPVLYDIELPYGRWQVGIHLSEPWNKLPNITLFKLWTAIIGMAACSTLILLVALRLQSGKERAEDDLAAAIESIEDGFAMFSPEDNLIMCNGRYAELYDLPVHLRTPGTPFEEILGYGLERGHYPEAKGRENEWLSERLHLHRNPTGSFVQRLTDGRWVKIAESKTENGSIVGFRVDITELKNAQEAAERANQIKSRFLSNINHEMRTPLTVMLGYLPILSDIRHMPAFAKLSAGLDATDQGHKLKPLLNRLALEVAGLSSRMHNSGQHLLNLVNDTLDLAKIEAGEMKIDAQPVKLTPLICSLIGEFAETCKSKGVEIRWSDADFVVLADEFRLRQILVNLITNAVKFTESGAIGIHAQQNASNVEIVVSDTGCGIPSEHLPKIFEEFYQGDASTTRKFGGTGLGLSISQNLARLQGGNIKVESIVGGGSKFKVTLPMVQEGAGGSKGSEVKRFAAE